MRRFSRRVKTVAKQETYDDVANAETGDDKIRKEVELLKMMSHSNFVRLEEVIETDDYWYFLMELIRGDEIFDLLADRGAFDEATARQIMRQLLEAIRYMHSKGIMHRDLKPENIRLAEAPGSGVGAVLVVKIADLSIAELVGLTGVGIVRPPQHHWLWQKMRPVEPWWRLIQLARCIPPLFAISAPIRPAHLRTSG